LQRISDSGSRIADMPRPPVEDVSRLPRLEPGFELVDSHCHLDMLAEDRERILERAAAAGVAAMVTIGAGGPMQCNHDAVSLAERHDNIYATVGTHPHNASEVDDSRIAEIRDLARRPQVVAIGETGLDYHYDNSPRPQQQDALRRFIALARELRLPIVVHLREADDDAARILREERAGELGGVIHCFSGDAASARTFLDLGFHLSFSGVLTFPTAGPLRDAARIVPADRMMIETDAPFLAPIPYRGKRNEPALVAQTAAILAEVRGESLEKVAEQTRANTARLFRLPSAS
jgi:TatD DNase family protein